MTAKTFLHTRLGDLASLHLGFSFRDRIERDPDGSVLVVQMRDLTKEQGIDQTALIRTNGAGFSAHHRLQEGDLVLRARGTNTMVACAPTLPENVVLAAPLLRIRVLSDKLTPRYLQLILNSPASQAFIAAHSQGTAVRQISKDKLASLPVIVPPLDVQPRIVELAELAEKEAQILEALAQLKRDYCQRAIFSLILEGKRRTHDLQD